MSDKAYMEQIADYLEKSDARDEARAQSSNPSRILYSLYALAPIMGFAVAAANVPFQLAVAFMAATWMVAGTAVIMDYQTGKVRHQFRTRAEIARENAHAIRVGNDEAIPQNIEEFLDSEVTKRPKYKMFKDPENAMTRMAAISFSIAASLVLGTSAVLNYQKELSKNEPAIKISTPPKNLSSEAKKNAPKKVLHPRAGR